MPIPALLALADGSVFRGHAVGAIGQAVGEVVFNTAMTGYQEILTDPSYARQIVTLTYPHIGNTGINTQDGESARVQAAGLVVRDVPRVASNWRSSESLTEYLQRCGTVAIAGIALAWLVYQRRTIDAGKLAAAFGPIRTAALHKFWIDDIYEGILAFALLAFSRIVGWLDRYLVDGVLNVVSAWTVSTGDLLRTVQTGRAQDYVYGVAVGLLILILWIRWALT